MRKFITKKSRVLIPAGLLLSTFFFYQCSKSDQAAAVKYSIDKSKAAVHVVSADEISNFKSTLSTRMAALPQGRLASSTLTLTPSTYFPISALRQLLSQPGVAGIRFYTGRQTDGSTTLFMVAADADQSDITNRIIGPSGSMELATAKALSTSFKASIATVNNLNLPAYELFNRDAMELLAQRSDITGIRIYWGSTNSNACMILLPVDAAGNDMQISLLKDAAPVTPGKDGGGDGMERGNGKTGRMMINP
ncbi:hypothetical protein [Chitinophaga sp. Cy-1792]|uniref:hypothetical protein n=1 Tax=Chitinophaga sp. Cy-1792 TaxID=2608339 RepID=UPI001423A192|nr:hypothetical protein [Chitinophaga sp. Cy-1792]NIG56437.1 hypothetical protein [Chitinophaga sp. Cy-1792]